MKLPHIAGVQAQARMFGGPNWKKWDPTICALEWWNALIPCKFEWKLKRKIELQQLVTQSSDLNILTYKLKFGLQLGNQSRKVGDLVETKLLVLGTCKGGTTPLRRPTETCKFELNLKMYVFVCVTS